jgi:hypothetical protein
MAMKKHFFRFGLYIIKDDSKTIFWNDKLLGDCILLRMTQKLYSGLYIIKVDSKTHTSRVTYL